MALSFLVITVVACIPQTSWSIRQGTDDFFGGDELALPPRQQQSATGIDPDVEPSLAGPRRESWSSLAAQSAFACAFPSTIDICDFSVIAKESATIGGHSLYHGIALGGNMTDGTPSQNGIICSNHGSQSCPATVGGSVVSWKTSPGRAVPQENVALSSVVDFTQFELLAQNLEAYVTNANPKVKVTTFTSGGNFSIFDFDSDGRETAGDLNLAVFNTTDDVFLKAGSGRKMGASILAPFSKVVLQTDHVDGFVVAREFVSQSGNQQMHGKCFTGALVCVPTPSPTPMPSPAPTPAQDPSAVGDPHVNNLAGEHFDINRPAKHSLLRVPLDPARPAQLELLGAVSADDPDNACAMYIRMMSLRGEWLGNATVQVRPLKRCRPGSNSAGDSEAWPFSLRQTTPEVAGPWRSMAEFAAGKESVEKISASVAVAARVRQEDFGSSPEAQAFEFLVGSGDKASIVVSQGQRQALNVQIKNLKALGQERLGGLLGTEKHDRDVEEPTTECKASKGSVVPVSTLKTAGSASRFSASW